MYLIPLLFAYFLSGFSALSYQLLWIRQLTLAFGNTTLAISAVLSAFMLGLAGGSWLGASLVKKSTAHRALILFSMIEVSLGFLTLVFKPLIGKLPLFLSTFLSFSLPPGFLHFIYFLSALLLLAPPAVLMGLTFPLIAHGIHGEKENHEKGILGWIYGVNTLGAVLGVISVGFIIVPILGVSLSYLLAVVCNFFSGGLAWISNQLYPAKDRVPSPVPHTPKSDSVFRVSAVLLFVTGLSSMMIEVAWTRAFALIIGSSIYAYSVILITYLLGLSLGGLFLGWIQSKIQLRNEWLPFFFLILGMSILAYLPLFISDFSLF